MDIFYLLLFLVSTSVSMKHDDEKYVFALVVRLLFRKWQQKVKDSTWQFPGLIWFV